MSSTFETFVISVQAFMRFDGSLSATSRKGFDTGRNRSRQHSARRRTKGLFAGALAAFLISGPVAQAQTVSIATTGNGTAIYFYGVAIAKAAAEHSDLDVRPKPYKSAGQGAVFVDRGEVEFGLHNAIVLHEAYNGLEFYRDRPLRNIRAVARLSPFRLTFGTRGDSGIETVADLAGKRFPTGFDATSFGDRLYRAMLATGGLTLDDVVAVPVSDWAALGKAFLRNDLDVNGLVVGSVTAQKYAQQIDGFHAISLGPPETASEALRKSLPNSRLVTAQPTEGTDGVIKPVVVLEYDYFVFAHADTPDDEVVALLEVLQSGGETMAAVSPDLAQFDKDLMYQDIGIPYHDAAIRFFAAMK